MQPIELFFVLALVGLTGGLIAGLIGIGGGTLYVFVLPSILASLHFPESHMAQFTIANSFTAIFFASGAAVYSLWKKNFFFLRPVLLIGLSAILSSFITNYYLVLRPFYSKAAFNVVVISLLFFSAVYTLKSARKEGHSDFDEINSWKLMGTGLLSGFMAALSGLGGGIVIIPILNTILKIDIKRASSVSSGAILLSAGLIVIQNLFQSQAPQGAVSSLGYVVLPVSLFLALGVVIGSPYGVSLSRRLAPATISYIYVAVLALVMIRKISELV
ncbi:MAG: sulfite exporter TauE/SafE family protein [Cytophagaceae bacterium]|jgi:uncharacterized membrane protein YfcA|nr:sulfite exporter TauE/SafE family protein [Cytophagaceae bacterium]